METATLVGLLLVLLAIILNVQPNIMLTVVTESDSDYLKFVRNADDLPMEAEYDYIIVGGGTAGCPLAATLSTSYSVLVLERGGIPQETPDVFTIEGFLNTLSVKDDGTYSPAADQFISEDGVANVRGRVLGGTSMINGAFYSRGDDDFYEKSGIEWDMGVVEEAYSWVEETIVSRPELKGWQSAVRKALLESGFGPDNGFSLDHIIGTKTGGSTFNASGIRHGAVELLNKAVPNNLQVAVHATVEKIIFSNSNSAGLSAVGVTYSDSNGKSHIAMVRDKGEVILSAGALGSTQLLLISGVGPQPYLSSLKIPTVHHQPHVGQFLVDNPRIGIAIIPPFPVEMSLVQVVGIPTDESYYIEALSLIIPFFSHVRSGIFPCPTSPAELPVATIFEKISRPLSVGSLKLASSTDVRITPIVRFNYFESQEDLNICVSAMRKIGELLESPSLDQFKSQDLTGARFFRFMGQPLPINQSDDASMEMFCRNTVTTVWHYHGGCREGKVVDGDFKVMGINALRVVDGSIFDVSPGTNPQATVMMMGRYSGLKILQERKAWIQRSLHGCSSLLSLCFSGQNSVNV